MGVVTGITVFIFVILGLWYAAKDGGAPMDTFY